MRALLLSDVCVCVCLWTSIHRKRMAAESVVHVFFDWLITSVAQAIINICRVEVKKQFQEEIEKRRRRRRWREQEKKMAKRNGNLAESYRWMVVRAMEHGTTQPLKRYADTMYCNCKWRMEILAQVSARAFTRARFAYAHGNEADIACNVLATRDDNQQPAASIQQPMERME